MKFAIVLIALIGITIANNSRDIKSEVKEIIASLPLDKIKALIREYLDTDTEVQQFVAYLKGDEWKSLVRNLRAEVNPDFKQFLLDAGINYDVISQKIINRIKVEKQGSTRSTTTDDGIRGFFRKLNELVCGRTVFNSLKETLKSSEKVQQLYAKLSSEEGNMYFNEFRSMESMQNIIGAIKVWGFDINKALDAYYKFLKFDN